MTRPSQSGGAAHLVNMIVAEGRMDYDPVNEAFRELEDAVYNTLQVLQENRPETETGRG